MTSHPSLTDRQPASPEEPQASTERPARSRRAFTAALLGTAGAAVLPPFTAVRADAATARAAGRSAAATPDTPYPHFYGANAHYDYSWSAQDVVDHLHRIGATSVRFNTGGLRPDHYNKVGSYGAAIAALDPGIEVVAVIDAGFSSTDEQTEYDAAYQGAQAVAQALGNGGITVFECGNELTTDPRVWPVPGLPGDLPDQYTGGNDWRCMRGWYRGLIDGVRSADSANRIGVDFCVAQIAASDMLWQGVEPDGSGGHPTVRWDITMWHNYEVNGNLFAMGTTGHGAGFNLIDYVSRAYGKPLMVTEWNANPEDADATKAAYTTAFMTGMWNNRAQYAIESIMLYQMDGGSTEFGLFACPQQTAAYTDFAANHPG